MTYDSVSAPSPGSTPRRLIAAPWHTLSILLIFGYFGFRQGTPQQALAPGSAQAAISHAVIIRGYLVSVAYEIGMAYWVWAGVHWKGGTLRDLTGGRWTSWRDVAIDLGILFRVGVHRVGRPSRRRPHFHADGRVPPAHRFR
jgi:hypothetical protein